MPLAARTRRDPGRRARVHPATAPRTRYAGNARNTRNAKNARHVSRGPAEAWGAAHARACVAAACVEPARVCSTRALRQLDGGRDAWE
eukprot:2738292-Prymnesium_polylepis.1